MARIRAPRIPTLAAMLGALAALVLIAAACAAPAAPPAAQQAAPTVAAAVQKAAPTVAAAVQQAAPTVAAAAKAAAPTAAAAAPTAAAAAGAAAPKTIPLPADAAADQTLRIAWQGFGSQEPLAPWSVRWGGQGVAFSEFLSPFYHDVDFNLKPLLATEMKPNADFTTWTMKLDPRAKWSDGSKLTAKQVKDSWEWVTAPAQKTSNITGYALDNVKGFKDMADGKAQEIAGVVVKDDNTLEFQLNAPDRFLDHKFAIYYLGVVPADKLKADPLYLTKPNPLVNGPYQVTAIDTTGRQVSMARNPNWWGDKPPLDKLELVVAEEQSAFEALVEKGQVDFGYSFADIPTRRKLVERTPGAKELANRLPIGIYSSVHNNVPPLDDINVRKALVHSVDWKELAAASTENTQQAWLGALHPELLDKCYDPKMESYFEYNVDKAKQFLAQSKYGSADKLGKLRVTSNSSGAAQKKAVQILMEYWRKNLGIEDIEFKEQPSGFGPDEKLVNIDRQSIGARPPIDGLWATQFRSSAIHATRFMAGYKNENLDKILAEVGTMDRKDANYCAKINEAMKVFLDDYMWLPLWRQSGDFGIVQPWVKNLGFGPYLSPYGWFGEPYTYVAKK